MYRIVVCMDINATSLQEAYSKLYRALDSMSEDIAWESTDEAFEPEGTPVDPEIMQAARMAFFESTN